MRRSGGSGIGLNWNEFVIWVRSKALIEQFENGVNTEEGVSDVHENHYLQTAKIAQRLDELKPDFGIADWGTLSDVYWEKGISSMQSQLQTPKDFFEDSGSGRGTVSSRSDGLIGEWPTTDNWPGTLRGGPNC